MTQLYWHLCAGQKWVYYMPWECYPHNSLFNKCCLRGDGGRQGNMAPWINWARCIRAHRDWSTNKHRAYMGRHQILCVYNIAISLAFFMGLLTMRMSGSLALWPTLGTLLPLGLPCPTSVWTFSLILLFYFVVSGCYLLEACSSLKRETNRLDLNKRKYGVGHKAQWLAPLPQSHLTNRKCLSLDRRGWHLSISQFYRNKLPALRGCLLPVRQANVFSAFKLLLGTLPRTLDCTLMANASIPY